MSFWGGFRVNFVVSVSSMGLPFQLVGLLCEYLSFRVDLRFGRVNIGFSCQFRGLRVNFGAPCQFVGFRVNFGVSMSISGSLCAAVSKTGYAMSIVGMPCLLLGMLCPFCCFRVNFGVFMSIFGLTGFAGSILGLCVN